MIDEYNEDNEDCEHYGIECEPEECTCTCGDCDDARLDYENEQDECGFENPSRSGNYCILVEDHTGAHEDAAGLTWRGSPDYYD